MSIVPFIVGEKVVYPNHGIAVIEQISSREIGTSIERSYQLCIHSSSLRVTVPLQNAAAIGLRRIASDSEAQAILEFLSNGECESSPDWKIRLKENSDKMRTGTLLEVARVLKGLLVLSSRKPLSPREKKMLESARFLLSSEMTMARGHEQEEVEEELRMALSKCELPWPELENVEA